MILFSAGAIQFLSTMPFEAVQSKSMWAVLFLAVDHKPDLATIIKYAGPDNIPSVKELDISPNEGIFLLTALSNMAISRNGIEDKELIEGIANLIIEVSVESFYIVDTWLLVGYSRKKTTSHVYTC